MELRQLEYFVGVAEVKHFTRAAEQLMVSQSGLSAAIRSLEEELGAQLFVRNTRSVHLTDVGTAFLPAARQTLARAAAAWSVVADVQGLLRGRLAVGTVQCLFGVDVPALLDAFHTKYPAVQIQLLQDGTMELIGAIRDGSIDLGFVSLGAHDVDDLDVIVLKEEPMVVACPPDHRLAAESEVHLTDLDGESFIDFTSHWGSREHADRMLAEAGVHREVALQVNDVFLLLDLVERGLGVAVVPKHFEKKTDKVSFRPISDTRQWRTALVTQPSDRRSRTGEAFLNLALS